MGMLTQFFWHKWTKMPLIKPAYAKMTKCSLLSLSSIFSSTTSTNTQTSIKIHDPLHLLHHPPTPIPNPHSSSVKRHWNLFQTNHIRKKITRSKHSSCLYWVLYIKLKQCFFWQKNNIVVWFIYLFSFLFF